MDRRQFVLAAGFSALFANKSFAQDWGGDRIAGRNESEDKQDKQGHLQLPGR